jgi:hypothetical protein
LLRVLAIVVVLWGGISSVQPLSIGGVAIPSWVYLIAGVGLLVTSRVLIASTPHRWYRK